MSNTTFLFASLLTVAALSPDIAGAGPKQTLFWTDYRRPSGQSVHRAQVRPDGSLAEVSDVYSIGEAGLGLDGDRDGTLYLTTGSQLHRIDDAGAGEVVEVSPFSGAGVAVDAKERFLYWADHREGGAIHRAPLGENGPVVGPDTSFIGGLSRPNALALVRTHGRAFLYWTTVSDPQGRVVQRAHLQSKGPLQPESVVQLPIASPDQLHAADGVAVDAKRGILFWVQRSRNSISLARLERLPLGGEESSIELGGEAAYIEWDATHDRLLVAVYGPNDSVAESKILAFAVRGLDSIGEAKVLIGGYQAHDLFLSRGYDPALRQ